MRRTCISLVLTTATLVACPGLASASERYEDAVGDATGDSPDIVAVTVSEPEGESAIRFDLELAPGRDFGTDMETWTDVVFILMSDTPDVDERGIITEGHYLTGTHGVTLAMQEQTGAYLVTPTDMLEGAVDVESSEDALAFTVDRELIGDPPELYFQVLLGVEREEQMSEGGDGESEMEGDAYPEVSEPPAHYRFSDSEGQERPGS